MKKTIANIFILSGILGSIYTLAGDPVFALTLDLSLQYVANLVVILLVLPILIVALIKVNPELTKFFK